MTRKKTTKKTTTNVTETSNSGIGNSGYYNSGDCNSGDRNSGIGNSGDRNSGDRNSGDYNSGIGNSGDRNSGDRNSGYGNSSDCNSGDYNSGYYNSGDGNSGDYNSGDCNSGDYNSGLFNTNEPKMRLFNRECEYTYSEFAAKFGYRTLNPTLTEWILSTDMTDAEKAAHPSHETTGGYLKTFTYKEAWSNAWKNANDEQKRWFLSLPNFDADIFSEITGIRVRAARAEFAAREMTEKKLYDCGVEDCGYCRATDITDDGYVWHDKRLKPCPFCGILGVAFCEGRTSRWREMYCVACEASCGEFCYDAPDGTAEEKALDLFERGLEIWNMRA